MSLEKLNFFVDLIKGELDTITTAKEPIDAPLRLKLRKAGKRIKTYTGLLLDQVNQIEVTQQPTTVSKK